ncbi:MAG: DUF3696 domain-containing protein [Acidimicrobiaceae bacterium]|nr:DUF3696 domain-containing protein [Acidimicrobiaceae bacterium]MDE0499200.1 DUF3696 domain-containing protein [Acidimicrobiaceae bacterium]
MFTSFSASSYKAWRATDEVALAPITGFFGANSSGKTSLLQQFLLLKQTVQSPDTSKVLDLGDDSASALVSVGGWQNLCFGRVLPQLLEFSFTWTPLHRMAVEIFQPETDIPDEVVELSRLTFDTEIHVSALRAFARRLSYRSDDLLVDLSRWHPRDPEVSWNTVTASVGGGPNRLRLLEAEKGSLASDAVYLPSLVHCYGFPNELLAHYWNAGFLRDLQLELEHQFERRLFYLGPRRGHGQRHYRWHGSEPVDVGPSGERTVDALLASRGRGRHNAAALADDGTPDERISVEEHVARMLRDLGLVTEFSVERASEDSELYRVKVQLTRTSIPVDLMDVGFGVSQLLPLLVLLAYVPESSTVLLEQPEMHLHPRIQSALADVLIDVTRTRKLQIILESHSEHLLMRLQRRIAEQRISREHVALYFCENDGKESSVAKLELDDCGAIANWPKDFFGDLMGETAAIVSAGLRHRAETEG